MGVDWFSCSACGDTFPDCGYYIQCEACGYMFGPCCGSSLCHKEIEEQGEIFDSETIEDCPGCAGQLTTTYYLTPENFKVYKTREAAEKHSQYIVPIEVPH